jgi:hypothetical protein
MLFLLATTLLARAADLPSTDVPELVDTPDGPREVHYKLVTELDIDGVTVEGVLIRPEIAIGSEVHHGDHPSQIRLRADFADQLASSSDTVR